MPDTPVARTAPGVRRLAATADLTALDARVSVCSACPRLVQWREEVAVQKRASFADQPYWGRPIAGWGSETPSLLIIGLAPAANGGNRTGRVFTGDRSGDWLFASLHRVGLAAKASSEHAGDGQALVGARVITTVRCAPPENKPTIAERDTCSPWIEREINLLAPSMKAVLALGGYGWDATLRSFRAAGYEIPKPKPKFAHAAEVTLTRPDGSNSVTVIGCFHPSQHNTFTGRLTEQMTDEVLDRARRLASLST